ncbi:MAG: IS110 family transposase [Actinobacteria bacterium]|nr:IS110 family transposase [Actinomycetota bacterium]
MTTMTQPGTVVRLGIDVACRAQHQASLADEAGRLTWSGRRFRTTPVELDELWSQLPDGAQVEVIMEPTRNAWMPLAAWLQARGARVWLVPPEQSADLRDYYHKHTKTDRLDWRVLARLPLLHPDGDPHRAREPRARESAQAGSASPNHSYRCLLGQRRALRPA